MLLFIQLASVTATSDLLFGILSWELIVQMSLPKTFQNPPAPFHVHAPIIKSLKFGLLIVLTCFSFG